MHRPNDSLVRWVGGVIGCASFAILMTVRENVEGRAWRSAIAALAMACFAAGVLLLARVRR